MPRKMISVAVVLALLVLTSGSAQAQPSAAQQETAGFFEQLWQWAVSNVAPIFTKDTSGIDPNGRTQSTWLEGAADPKPGADHLSRRTM